MPCGIVLAPRGVRYWSHRDIFVSCGIWSLSGHCRHGRTCCWLYPVASDPLYGPRGPRDRKTRVLVVPKRLASTGGRPILWLRNENPPRRSGDVVTEENH